MALCYHGETKRSSNWRVWGIYWEDLHTLVTAIEGRSVWIERLRFFKKIKMNNTLVIPLYTQKNISPMNLHNIVIKKKHFSSPLMINGSFICLKRRLVAMDKQSSLFFSLKVRGTQMPRFLTFPIFFKGQQIVLRSSANSRVNILGLHSSNSLYAYLS